MAIRSASRKALCGTKRPAVDCSEDDTPSSSPTKPKRRCLSSKHGASSTRTVLSMLTEQGMKHEEREKKMDAHIQKMEEQTGAMIDVMKEMLALEKGKHASN